LESRLLLIHEGRLIFSGADNSRRIALRQQLQAHFDFAGGSGLALIGDAAGLLDAAGAAGV
jgi:hypothetical protein